MSQPSIHGHEVIHMVLASGRPWGRSELIAKIAELHGVEARFHTCSAEGLSGEGLVDFLAAKGKFVTGDAGMTFDESKLCSHGDGHHD